MHHLAPNALRRKLAQGSCVSGSAICSSSPNIVEAACQSGIDFVRIDTEHAWHRDESLQHMVRAALLYEVVPLVRIDPGDPLLVRKVLEVGAGGLIVSQVRSADEVRQVVASTKFPPLGTRSYGTATAAAAWGALGGRDWIEWSNTEPLVGVMIETREAVQDLPAILAVDGLDFVVFGASDLAMSLGLGEPDPEHPSVKTACDLTLKEAARHGKHVMKGVGVEASDFATYRTTGVSMFELPHDVAIVRTTIKSALARLKAPSPPMV